MAMKAWGDPALVLWRIITPALAQGSVTCWVARRAVRRAAAVTSVGVQFGEAPAHWTWLWSALRPLEWLRNVLVFAPLVLATEASLPGAARRALLALVPLYVEEEKMDKAKDALILGRAMFPQDPGWQARLKLLEAIQAMAKPDRGPWIQLLG